MAKQELTRLAKLQVLLKQPLYTLGLLIVVLLTLGLIMTVKILTLSNKPSNLTSQVKGISKISVPVAKAATPPASASAIPTKPTTNSAGFIQSIIRHGIRVPIFYYHYIGNNPNPADKTRNSLSVPPDKFDAQMGYLAKNGYTPITLNSLFATLDNHAVLPPKPLVLTFDDGYVDFYINAFPILEKYHFHAVAFIPTSLVGTGYYLNWGQISAMNSSGLIEFEAHSLTHPNLVSLSYDQQRKQIFESKAVLETHIGHPVNFFAYPYGTANGISKELVQEAGYIAAFGTWSSPFISTGTLFDEPRIRVPGQSGVDGIARRL